MEGSGVPVCRQCGRELSNDERAIYKRLINRGACESEFLCRQCLAGFFEVPVSVIDEKIEHFKKIGCLLFM